MAKKEDTILHNQYLLYVIFAMSCIHLFYFASIDDYVSITMFVLVGFLTSFFSKNMIVILCISMAVSQILKKGNYEGMEDKTDESSSLKPDVLKPPPEVTATIKKTYTDLHSHGTDLLSVQGEILKNFEVMNPLIKRAEDLVASMNKSIDTMTNITK